MKALALLLLLVAPVAHCQLPALPDSVPSAVGWVPVRRVAHPCGGDEGTLGCFRIAERVIEIRKDSLSRIQEHVALEHERAHMNMFDAAVPLEHGMQEFMARVISTARVREMLATRLAPPRGTP